jgi:hypothetical protein
MTELKTAKDLQDGKEVGRIGYYAPDIVIKGKQGHWRLKQLCAAGKGKIGVLLGFSSSQWFATI